MVNTQGLLSIIVTFDPFPGVMDNFLRAISDFSSENPYNIEVIVVNGFTNISLINDVSYDNEKLKVRFVPSAPGEGQSSAILHGIALSGGSVVLSIDPDMYMNIPYIHVMLDRYGQGSQVVFTRRVMRRDIGLFRLFSSHFFSLILSLITGSRIKDFNSPMFLVSREVVNALVPLGLPAETYKFRMYFTYKDHFSQVDIAGDAGSLIKKSHYNYVALVRLFFIRIRESLQYNRYQ